MTDFFNENVSAFSRHSSLFKTIPEPIDKHSCILKSKSGALTARINKTLLHSQYDPLQESEELAKNIETDSRIFLYGLGLGYHVLSILKRLGDNGRLLVLELNPQIVSLCFHLNDFCHLATDPRFHLIFGGDEQTVSQDLSKQMSVLNGNPEQKELLQVLFHNPSYQCFPRGFPKIKASLEVLRLERRTPKILGNIETRNYQLNENTIRTTDGINFVRNKYLGKPAFLISAGPSLDSAIPAIEKLSGKALVGCVDTSFPVLRHHNIRTDYVFSLDPQELSFQHFKDHLNDKAVLVHLASAQPRIVRYYRGKKIVVFKEEHNKKKLSHLPEIKGTTQAGGSVSCLALDCLIQMGCNPIVLIGQDCVYRKFFTHARQTLYEQRDLKSWSRTRGSRSMNTSSSQTTESVEIKSNLNQSLTSDHTLFSYLRTLEQIVKTHPQVKVYSFSPHGAAMDNIYLLGSMSEVSRLLKSQQVI